MITLGDHLRKDLVLVNFAAKNKEEALQNLTQQLKDLEYLADESGLLESLLEREAIKSTGVGHGIAVPHTNSEDLDDTIVCIALVPEGIEYNSLDNKPVHVIFLLVGPETNRNLHLQLLAKISRIVTQTNCLAQLRGATDVNQVYQTLISAEEELASERD